MMPHPVRILLLLVLTFAGVPACSDDDTDPVTEETADAGRPRDRDARADTSEPMEEPDVGPVPDANEPSPGEAAVRIQLPPGELPRFALPGHLAHLFGRPIGPDNDVLHLFTDVVLSNLGDAPARVFVEARLAEYSSDATVIVDVPAGATTPVPPFSPTLDLPAIGALSTPVTTTAEVRVHDGTGTTWDIARLPVDISPINRIQWFSETPRGLQDNRWSVVTLITPDDGDVHALLRIAAARMPDGRLIGSLGDRDRVGMEIRAIWDALQALGTTYVNIPGSFFDGAQYVRLPAESLGTLSANCIDGSLVFASAFEALGLQPVLYFVTGHAFVGVRTAPGEIPIAIETTVVSSRSLDDANQLALANLQNAQASGDPYLLFLDVIALRQRGVIPVPLNE